MPEPDRIRHLDLETLVRINKRIVSLTRDKHEYTEEDKRSLRDLLAAVENTANEEERVESLIRKASLLVLRIASGQHFHEGNKRTALVAAESFLKVNGYTIDIQDSDIVDIVDKASIGQASLSKVDMISRRLIRNV